MGARKTEKNEKIDLGQPAGKSKRVSPVTIKSSCKY